MKSVYVIVLIWGVHLCALAQSKAMDGNEQKATKTVELPEVVVKSAGKDFSIYLPDKNPDPSVTKLQNDFIAYDLGKNYEGYDNFLVILEGEKGILTATYDSTGKLTSVVEKYNNAQLPAQVIYSVYKAYPGWQIVNDKFLYTQENGDIKKKEYSLRLKKQNEILKLKVNPSGEFIADVD